MLPGQLDFWTLAISILGAVVPIVFTVITGYAFAKELRRLAAAEGKSIWSYVSFNLWKVIQGPAALFIAFLLTAITTTASLIGAQASNQREMELKRAFGAGIWYGYANNFLDKVVKSFAVNGYPPPHIVLVSPSYDVTGQVNLNDLLYRELPAALTFRGYTLNPLWGKDTDPGWFRQTFIIQPRAAPDTVPQGQGDLSGAPRAPAGAPEAKPVPVYFDLPTTLRAFEGAIDAVMERRDKYITAEQRNLYFEDFKCDFFTKAVDWAKKNGAPLSIIHMETRSPAAFADVLVARLKAIDAFDPKAPPPPPEVVECRKGMWSPAS